MRVGVTGHRMYDDADRVLERIEEAVGVVRDRTTTPLQIWSALAEGADRAVAQAVLATPGATLVAVLPLCADDYRHDFTDDESRAEFERLLAGACRVIVTGPDGSGTRSSAYWRAGELMLDQIELLFAVWDGKPARGHGGTAEVVASARARDIDVVVIDVTRNGASA